MSERLIGAEGMSKDLLLAIYLSMLRIRVFEETVAELVEAKEIKGPAHLYVGQEAVATGVCANLRPDDYVWGNHRSHGHYLAKGGDISKLMAEIFCKSSGCSMGRGGSMHLFAQDVGILGTVPMVSATIPIAVGAALSSVMHGSDRVSIAFFGDGATEEGVFHEALNFAALRKLPVVFICENNFFASHLPLRDRRPADNLYELASPYSMTALKVDGNDVVAVYQVAKEAVERARAGKGPSFLECRTYRWRGHVGPGWDLDMGIRERDELNAWMARCPVKTFREKLIEHGFLSHDAVEHIQEQVTEEVDSAVRFARESPYPAGQMVLNNVFVDKK